MARDQNTGGRGARYRRRGLIVGVALAGILVIGATYQRVGEARDRAAAPPPGRLITVNGSEMHVHCTGAGEPVVVLEAGATGFAQTWAWIQPALARHTRVCSYDRAGMGWSGPGSNGHDARAIARNLHDLLRTAGEPAPYIMIGHSLGGSLVQAFTGMYPDAVVGLGMVDPSHPDQLARFGDDVKAQQEKFQQVIGLAAKLGHVGVLRATNVIGKLASGLPPDDYRSARMFAASPRHLQSSYREMRAWEETMAAARTVTSFGNRPMVVISATENMEGMPEGMLQINHEMHAELAAQSTAGRHVLLHGTDHYSLLMDERDAEQTAEELTQLIAAVRAD